MRITEKRYPILKYLKWDKNLFLHKDLFPNKHFFQISTYDKEVGKDKIALKIGKELSINWPKYRQYFLKEINVVSKPLADVIIDNSDRLISLDTVKILLGKGPVSGTLIWKDFVICYHIRDITEDGFDGVVIGMGDNMLLYAAIGNEIFANELLEREHRRVDSGDDTSMDFYYQTLPLLFHLFKRYAIVEVVMAKPFKKVPIPIGEDEKDNTLLVDSTLPVKYYDCSWFRTIVRREGFMVRGHFRMQPYKNEKREWDYKLIYIEPYQKHGYIRTAKKVIEARRNNNEMERQEPGEESGRS